MADEPVTNVNPTNPNPEPEIPAQYKGKTFADMIKIVEDNKRYLNTRIEEEASKRAALLSAEAAEKAASDRESTLKGKAQSITDEFKQTGRLSEKSKEEAKALGLDQLLDSLNDKFKEIDQYNTEKTVSSLASKMETSEDHVRRVIKFAEEKTANSPKDREALISSIKSGKLGLLRDYAEEYQEEHTTTLKGSFNTQVSPGAIKDINEFQKQIASMAKNKNVDQLFEQIENTPWLNDYMEQKIAEMERAKEKRMTGGFGSKK